MAVVSLAIIVYFYPHQSARRYVYEQGKPWNYAKLIAPFDFVVNLDSATVRAKSDSVRARFVPVARRADEVKADSIGNEVVSCISRNLGGAFGALSESVISRQFGADVRRVLSNAYATGVVSDSLAKVAGAVGGRLRIKDGATLLLTETSTLLTPMQLYRRIDSVADKAGMRTLLSRANVGAVLVPNIVYDRDDSERLLSEDIAAVTVPRNTIQNGQTIIDNGTVITAKDYATLKAYERAAAEYSSQDTRSNIMNTCGQVLYVAFMLAALVLYLAQYEPKISRSMRSMLFVFSLIVLFFVLGAALDRIIPSIGIYLMPLAIVPVLVLVFFSGRVALMTGAVLTLLCAGITEVPLQYITLQTVAICAAVYSLRQLSRRSQLLRASFYVFGALLVAYVTLQLLAQGSLRYFSWRMVAVLGSYALLTSMAYVLMSAVERLFGFVSNVTLVELADVNAPLLRQLSDECPGTFQHSIAVSNLAGDAAQRIGANPMLTRAGALYHDIGKLSNPMFFTENQHGVNPHDGLDPKKSAEIIINHVSDGLRRAERAGIPAVIRDFISQHHGTGKAKYFYFTYCREHPGEDVDPAPFTYPGPNPKTREASVLMMADSVEAASRSLRDNAPKSIRELVDKIIDGQIADGLHNDSPLSFRDVSIIKESFARRLATIYHSRISYPDDPTKNNKEEKSSL